MFLRVRQILGALDRLEEEQWEQRKLLELLAKRLGTPHPSPAATPSPQGEGRAGDAWLQEGIDNILAYQAGSRKEERR